MISSNNNRSSKCASESPEKQTRYQDSLTPLSNVKKINGSTTSLNEAIRKENNNYKFSNSDLYDYTNESYKSLDSNYNRTDEVFSSQNEQEKDREFDGLIFRDVNNSTQTMKILNALRKNRQLCDLILQLDDDSQDIYCHQIILACNSKFFMEIFTNYEIEQQSNSNLHLDQNETETKTTENSSNQDSKLNNIRKKSFQALVNKNHNSTHRQLLFCLSDYLKHFLKDNNHHHYAKINSIINHNSPYHHHYNHNNKNTLNHHVDAVSCVHDDKTHHINLNMDYEALKLCIDYMYTSKLKVPSYLLPHVYTLAYHLSFENIVNACAQYLNRHLNVDNCLSIRSFALDENLIQSSTQCIEKNIDYILQLKPNFKSSNSSLSSSSTNLNMNGHSNNVNGVKDLTMSEFGKQETLSSSINLANKEFNHLPRVNIELVGIKANKAKLPDNIVVLTQLCMNWLVEELVNKTDQTLNDLCDNLSMLYMNKNDHTLHDCCDMDASDTNFNDHINDYQKQHNSNPVNGSNSPPILNGTNHKSVPNRLKTFKITDQELNAIGTATPIKFKVLHDNEIICTQQVSENSFITICTLTGKLVTLSVHILFTNNESDLQADCNQVTDNNNKLAINTVLISDTESLEHQNPALNRTMSTHSNPEPERLAKMRLARCGHGVVSYDKKLYVIGGYERGECLNLCEVYDPKANTIEEIGCMENRRGRAAVTWLESNKTIYVMGGSDGHEDLNSIECYDLINQKWKTVRFEYELGFTNLAAIGCDNYIYLVGLKDLNKNASRTCCLRYEPTSNTFIRLAELNYSRSQSGLVWNNSGNGYFLYVFGGYDSMRCLSSCEVYNVQEDKWTIIANMLEPRRGCGAAIHRETQMVYIVGGTNGSHSLKSVEIYDIKNKKWTTGPELNIARNNVSIEFIGDILLAVGGFDGKSFLKTIEYLNVKNLNDGWSMYHKQGDFEFLNNQ